LTVYYNGFYRDWFKLSKVNGVSQQTILSKANTVANNLNIFKGLAAGNITYKNNDRQYAAYGIKNETDLKFNTDFFGKNIGHDFKFGFKYHYDKINRDQQTHTFTQAVGGQLSQAGVTYADDRNESTQGYALYFEEAATINNFVVSFGSRLEFLDQHYRDKAATMGTTSNLKEETWAFVPGGGLLYNHDENWQWFAGVYKGFNTAGPSASRDNGNPLQPEKSIAKEIGVRYGDNNLAMSVTGFHTDFKDVIVIDNSNAGGNPDNGGNVVSKGLELSTVYNPDNLLGVGDISFFANYTFTNANLDGDSTTTDTESIFAGGRDGSNVPYIPEHVLSFGADYEINKFDFGINMTYHSETYGTAEETETEESIGSANARAGRIDSAFLLNLRAGYKINDNYRVVTGVNNATDLQYISSRHPTGARAGAPLTAYIKAVASFDSIF
jgi:Fe(3+) dicitrate transport protein